MSTKKLVGYLDTGLLTIDYLTIENAVFKDDCKENLFVQQLTETGMNVVEVTAAKVKYFDNNIEIFISNESDFYYLAVYNNEMEIAAPLTRFLKQLVKLIPQKKLSYINQYSLYSFLEIRFQVFNSIKKSIEINELKLEKSLTIDNFTVNSLTYIGDEKIALKDIVLFYSEIVLKSKGKILFQDIFNLSDLDETSKQEALKNNLVLGNYVIEANELLTKLQYLMKARQEESIRQKIQDFAYFFMKLFNLIIKTPHGIESYPVNYFSEDTFTSNQTGKLKFDQNLVKALLNEFKFDNVASSRTYKCAPIVDVIIDNYLYGISEGNLEQVL